MSGGVGGGRIAPLSQLQVIVSARGNVPMIAPTANQIAESTSEAARSPPSTAPSM
jgi:hypothetical protein